MGLIAGRLRHKLALQRKVQTRDPATGAVLTVWRTYANVHGEVAPASAREFQAAAAEQSEVRGKITIRYRADVDATHRAIHRGKAYEFLGVLADNESGLEWLTLPVGEGVRVAP
jgi:SPP1 family predicted phage head-tail adaptor